MKRDRINRALVLVPQLVLALLSFLFFKIIKAVLGFLAHIRRRTSSAANAQWWVLSRDNLRKPLVLPLVSTAAPRWNTHAIVARAGPLTVQSSLQLDTKAAERSAGAWTVVVSAYPGRRVVATVGSHDSRHYENEGRVNLAPGQYTLALRYYHWSEHVTFPAVAVDRVPAVPAAEASGHVNDFYADLKQRRGLFFLSLHYYMWVLLQHREWWPRWFVEQEFLPVGNPETRFYYGAFERGQSLSVQLDPALLATHDVYLTIYNRCSFPSAWCQIRECQFSTDESAVDACYLVRVHPKGPSQSRFEQRWVQVSTS